MKHFPAPPGFDPELAAEFLSRQTSRRIGTDLVRETDTMLIWHLRPAPGERLGFYRHDRPCFWSIVGNGRAHSRYDDGRIADRFYKAGDTQHLPVLTPDTAFVHDIENIGDTEFLFVTVEFKMAEEAVISSR